MSRVQSVARFRIHPGKSEEFKRLSAECVALARAKDPGTLRYQIFLNADETEAVVYEEYVDSAACVAHFENMGENAAKIFAIVDGDGLMMGEPSDELRAGLEAHDVSIYAPFMSLHGEADQA